MAPARQRSIRRGLLMVSVMFIAAASAGQGRSRGRIVAPLDDTRAPLAFHYAPSLSPEALAWYSRFDVLVTHDPLPRDQVEQLHAAGTKVLFYEWSVAFYESRATAWQRSLLSDGRDLLNETPLTGWAGSMDSAAWYFDPMSPEHEFGRVEDIVRRLRETGYDGVFFDTTTVASVHPEARKEYEIRHPHVPYDLAFSRFLVHLRQRHSAAILFTNQGYRSAEHYLPHVDWDLTESLITGPENGSYQLRAWNDASSPWSSTYFVMRTMIEPLAAKYPHVRFGHLNYVSGASAEKIRIVVAAAQLFGGHGYAAAPSVGEEADAIYFRDAGKAVSPLFDTSGGKAAWRFFENGLIVVTAANHEITIRNLSRKGLRNHLTGELHCGDTITLPATPEGTRAHFFDYSAGCR
ncbi:MAG TPA: hypothetical protein VNA04_01765 [Thermoanaerobaculia bacterium]|nr:hypothetical protein [Thermoanaerobaculia bacterium]